ncbi:hypothetical protein P280DRAFT_227843 [Massarina eburnea CBS 473.64]|uniref:Uncharacterized protein n=1 Tax=Massarina eburnea CBS 473.64 TaxID=1395130 RepID=A0A6A6SBL8_9PLEO|nr:hypothetical protein P280DRAFT_227843 [Massarina eburnea CBS 473.64]
MEATQYQKPQQQHQPYHRLPPSPPPSPPAARKRHQRKKLNRHDPFLDLGEINSTTVTPRASSDSLPRTPTTPSNPDKEEKEVEESSLLNRIIITPILFTSFLLSLFLINRADRLRRTKPPSTNTANTTHPPSASLPNPLFTLLTPSTWLNPEPYQDPTTTTTTTTPPPTPPRNQNNKRPWHLHNKIRKIAHLEISDALEMRGRVIVGMGVVGLVVICVAWVGARWVVGRVWG